MRRHKLYLSVMGCISLAVVFGILTTSLAHPEHSEHQELPGSAFRETSLYQVTSTWITATEQLIHLEALRGKVQVLAMFSTTCEYTCPLLVSIMQQIEAALPAELLPQGSFVLMTFDPERDTPRFLASV